MNIPSVYALGHLHSLWYSVLEQQEDGDLSKWSDELIAEMAQYKGKPDVFVSSLVLYGWLDGRLIHDWLDYAGRYLTGKYRSSDPSRLLKIWNKHKKRYDKAPGRQVDTGWFKIRKIVLERDKYICHYCGKKKFSMEVDHIIPVESGGKDEIENLVSACRSCNRKKSNKPYESQPKASLKPDNLPNLPYHTKPNQTNHTKPNKIINQEMFLFLKDSIFLKTFNNFLDMRKSIKKGATDHAQNLILKKLHNYDIKTAIGMLEQSIEGSWTGIYEVKNQNNLNLTKAQKQTQASYFKWKEDMRNENNGTKILSPGDGVTPIALPKPTV